MRWKPPTGVRFQKAAILDAGGKQWLGGTGGELRLERGPHGLAQRISLSEFLLPADFFHSFPGLPLEGVEDGALQFRETVFYLEGTGSARHLRILKMSSPALEFQGSVWWAKERVEKADLLILIPSAWAQRLPQDLEKRLSSSVEGKKILKCAYRNDQLTLYGSSGPLFRAAWSPGGVNEVERG